MQPALDETEPRSMTSPACPKRKPELGALAHKPLVSPHDPAYPRRMRRLVLPGGRSLSGAKRSLGDGDARALSYHRAGPHQCGRRQSSDDLAAPVGDVAEQHPVDYASRLDRAVGVNRDLLQHGSEQRVEPMLNGARSGRQPSCSAVAKTATIGSPEARCRPRTAKRRWLETTS